MLYTRPIRAVGDDTRTGKSKVVVVATAVVVMTTVARGREGPHGREEGGWIGVEEGAEGAAERGAGEGLVAVVTLSTLSLYITSTPS